MRLTKGGLNMLKHETEQFERTVRMLLDSPSLDYR